MTNTRLLKQLTIIFIAFVYILSAAGCIPKIYKTGVDYDDFPDRDIPIYDDAIVFDFDGDDEECEIEYGTEDDVDDITDFYQDELDDDEYLIIFEEAKKDEYRVEGYTEDYYFEIEVEEANGDEEKYFESVVSISIEETDEDMINNAEIANEETTPSADGPSVGIVMPTEHLQRWNNDGNNLKDQLEAKGYYVNLSFAKNDAATQISQIETMILLDVDVLIVACVDGWALDSVLQIAKEEGIIVIAYDRLLMNTEAVDYYVSFDNLMVGTLQGQYIVDALGLDEGNAGPYNMEVFAGSPDDWNAYYFNKGAMDVLKPYIEAGVLAVKSGEGTTTDEWTSIGIQGWSSMGAQERMDNLLAAYYYDENIDVILSPNDSLAQGITASLSAFGYGTEDKPFPIVTGQDCDINSILNIINGAQSMSVFKDTRDMVARTVIMVEQIIAGQEVEANNVYDNNIKNVPSYLCMPKVVDIHSYKELMIDSGYYPEDALK